MYRCARCGADIEEGFDRCWNCGEPVPAALIAYDETAVATPELVHPSAGPTAAYREFRGDVAEWSTLLTDAAAFATELGPRRVISVAHAVYVGAASVIVWYWDGELDANGDDASASGGEG